MTATIFAVSSGRLPAAIAVVRVSGPRASAVALALAGPLPPPRRASVRSLRDANGGLLDRALCLWFPGPATATGEDLIEFHCHGGPAVAAALCAAIDAVAGTRPADAGEFTRRALASGRIDLSQARGLADLLSAQTDAQRRTALSAAEGAIGRLVVAWMDRLSAIAAQVEAAIDFDEEDDVAGGALTDHLEEVRGLVAELDDWLARPGTDWLSGGIRIALAGPPNVGKSSLFNALLARDAAIVTDIAGTTRDVIEVGMVYRDTAFVLIDTAGLAVTTEDPVEKIGITRARQAAASADLVLWLDDAAPICADRHLLIHPRSDLPTRGCVPAGRVAISINDPTSIAHLWTQIVTRTAHLLPQDPVAFDRDQRATIAASRDDLADIAHDMPIEVVADRLRRAGKTLGVLLGLSATEAMLDALFGRFCIGK